MAPYRYTPCSRRPWYFPRSLRGFPGVGTRHSQYDSERDSLCVGYQGSNLAAVRTFGPRIYPIPSPCMRGEALIVFLFLG